VGAYSQNRSRQAHWIQENQQCRIPKRHVVFDTESKFSVTESQEIQSWRMGAAIRFRYGLKTGDKAEASVFRSVGELWEWVTDFCRTGQRTVVWAHNLGYDVRISEALSILPELGWRLEWCNLDRNVSSMTWRSERGTLCFADTWTWLPLGLSTIAPSVGLAKLNIPRDADNHASWEKYCMRDAEICYRVVSEILKYIGSENLGNWQPTGAGMSYATWRHRFMSHKVLVHDDHDAIAAERAAMHTGRAEAWRHGDIREGIFTECDMKDAYIRIAAECDLPVKLKFRTGRITGEQYARLTERYRVLLKCNVSTSVPCVPYHDGTRHLWPVGQFETWLWDCEADLLTSEGQTFQIQDSYCYTRAPILADWASWVLSITGRTGDDVSSVVRTWIKHCGRALIGRLALRSPTWEQYGANPTGETGISHLTDVSTGVTHRLMHIGGQTLIETAREEGRDSLPQVTGWIMAQCRVRLWGAMRAAGLAEVAHVDTDSVLVSAAGLAALRAAQGAGWRQSWQVKGSWRRLVIYGPRNYRAGKTRKASGIPRGAVEVLPNVFEGERWHGVARDLEDGRHNRVTIERGRWEMTKADPRRRDAPGAATRTEAYETGLVPVLSVSSSSVSGDGA
jgi:hypothetical protein